MALTRGEAGAAGGNYFSFAANPMSQQQINERNAAKSGRAMDMIFPQSSRNVPYTPPDVPVQQWYPRQDAAVSQSPMTSNPVNGSGFAGGTSGGGIAGGGGSAASQRLTADDFASQYKGNDKGLALTDSTFGDQQSQYANILKKYIEDYTRQYGHGGEFDGTLGRDAKTAVDGIARNRENGLTSQAEDFFARGIGNSGMFAQEQQKAGDQYTRQNTNVLDSLRDQRATLDFNKGKMESENGANGSNIQNARRDAYNRLALRQNLV